MKSSSSIKQQYTKGQELLKTLLPAPLQRKKLDTYHVSSMYDGAGDYMPEKISICSYFLSKFILLFFFAVFIFSCISLLTCSASPPFPVLSQNTQGGSAGITKPIWRRAAFNKTGGHSLARPVIQHITQSNLNINLNCLGSGHCSQIENCVKDS